MSMFLRLRRRYEAQDTKFGLLKPTAISVGY
jgi:hypothetical protein